MFTFQVGLLLALASASLQVVHATSEEPVVKLPYGQYQGITNVSTGLSYFLGMRYAAAPVGPLRYAIPHSPPSFSGIHNASHYGAACIQQNAANITIPGVGSVNLLSPAPSNQSEDCLFINVIKPSRVHPHAKLPVIFWIFGGAFELGDTSQNDGSPVVQRSVTLGEPVIYVSANYRLNAYGFLASKEIQAARAGNLGLQDQRYALEWVQKNVHLFGGDKNKVTLWGTSSGAASASLHLVINGGNPAGLFRGAFMNSGSPLSCAGMEGGQRYYDVIVNGTGCSNATDTLECLRRVPAETITNVVQTRTPNIFSFQGLQAAYQPRVDGEFIKKNPWDSITEGAYAKVPFVTGDSRDEGTIFALPQANITTGAEVLDYIHRNFFPKASVAEIQEIGRLYPDNPSLGSPFGTGNASNLFPQYKRLSAIEGDAGFQGPRRNLLETASKTQNTWAFDYRRSDALSPTIGIHHGAEGFNFGFLGTTPDFQGIDAVINFVNHLSPVPPHQNSSLSSVQWPTWGSNDSHPILTFWDPIVLNITSDREREDAIKGVSALMRKFPVGFTDLPVSA